MNSFPLTIVTPDGLQFEGQHDEIPESFFLYAGSIDEVVAKYKGGEA